MACPADSHSLQAGQAACECNAGFAGADAAQCTACVAGKYKASRGPADCDDCEAGKYKDTAGMNVACDDCEAGKYKGTTGMNVACDDCEAGKYQDTAGVNVACYDCEAGTYLESSGVNVACDDCEPGKYSDVQGADSQSDCQGCVEGKTSARGSGSEGDCTAECSPGWTGTPGSCTQCLVGTYKDTVGSGDCMACPADSHSSQTGQAACECNAGFTGADAAQCTACVAGKYKALRGPSACTDCEAGKYVGEASSACQECEAGKYEVARGQPECTGSCLAGKYSTLFGSPVDTCQDCPEGTYGNDTSASACVTCPEGETTTSRGSTSCECKVGYTRDCASGKCTRCNSDQLYKEGLCTECPDGAECDGSDQMTCAAGYYIFVSDTSICHPCPLGGDCSTGTFAPIPSSSLWERNAVGEYRVWRCPKGYALTREDTNPSGDACVPCPQGSYNLEGSAWNSESQQSGTVPPPNGFCDLCPRVGATCPGGSAVHSKGNYYTFEEVVQSSRRAAVNETVNRTVIKAYACPLGACAGNNTCNGGRVGLLCGFCPEYTALELNVCVECERDSAATMILQIVVGVLALLLLFLILFLLGWRHVYADNVAHRTYDKVLGIILTLIERVSSMFETKGPVVQWKEVGAEEPVTGTEIKNDALATAISEKQHFTKKEVDDFNLVDFSYDSYIKVGGTYFQPDEKVQKAQSDPARTRRFIQAAKIFFAYYQVISTFIVFKVRFFSVHRS